VPALSSFLFSILESEKFQLKEEVIRGKQYQKDAIRLEEEASKLKQQLSEIQENVKSANDLLEKESCKNKTLSSHDQVTVSDPNQAFGGEVKLGGAKNVLTSLNTKGCLRQKRLSFLGQQVAIFVGRTMLFFRE